MSTSNSVRGLFALALVIVSLGAACRENPVAPADVPLGQPFDLRVGESATVPGQLKITFDRVVADSRCPIDAICVTAGEAVLAFKLSQGAEAAIERELRFDSPAARISHRAYTIHAVALAPYPRSDRKILPAEFVATIQVTR